MAATNVCVRERTAGRVQRIYRNRYRIKQKLIVTASKRLPCELKTIFVAPADSRISPNECWHPESVPLYLP